MQIHLIWKLRLSPVNCQKGHRIFLCLCLCLLPVVNLHVFQIQQIAFMAPEKTFSPKLPLQDPDLFIIGKDPFFLVDVDLSPLDLKIPDRVQEKFSLLPLPADHNIILGKEPLFFRGPF